MRLRELIRQLIALFVVLAMSGSLASPVWAGPECPHAAGHHARHALKHSDSTSEFHFVNPDKPCKCAEHADMTMAECVALAMGMALPANTQALSPVTIGSSFFPTALPIRSGMVPERDPYPPKFSSDT